MQSSLISARLELTAVRPEDADDLHVLFGDPLTHTIGSGALPDVGDTAAWVARRIAIEREHGLRYYVARLRSDGTLVAACGLLLTRASVAEPEVGWEVHQPVRRRGLGTEIAHCVLQECDRIRLRRVWATIRPRNEASLAIAARLGFRRDRLEHDEKGELVYLLRDAQVPK